MAIETPLGILHEASDFGTVHELKDESISYGYTKVWEQVVRKEPGTHALKAYGVIIPLGTHYDPQNAELVRREQMERLSAFRARQSAPSVL